MPFPVFLNHRQEWAPRPLQNPNPTFSRFTNKSLAYMRRPLGRCGAFGVEPNFAKTCRPEASNGPADSTTIDKQKKNLSFPMGSFSISSKYFRFWDSCDCFPKSFCRESSPRRQDSHGRCPREFPRRISKRDSQEIFSRESSNI